MQLKGCPLSYGLTNYYKNDAFGIIDPDLRLRIEFFRLKSSSISSLYGIAINTVINQYTHETLRSKKVKRTNDRGFDFVDELTDKANGHFDYLTKRAISATHEINLITKNTNIFSQKNIKEIRKINAQMNEESYYLGELSTVRTEADKYRDKTHKLIKNFLSSELNELLLFGECEVLFIDGSRTVMSDLIPKHFQSYYQKEAQNYFLSYYLKSDVKMYGIPDLVLRIKNTGNIYLIDFKTGRYKSEHLFQLYLYARWLKDWLNQHKIKIDESKKYCLSLEYLSEGYSLDYSPYDKRIVDQKFVFKRLYESALSLGNKAPNGYFAPKHVSNFSRIDKACKFCSYSLICKEVMLV